MIKYRIGILGTENSHANCFADYINKPDENGNMRCPDCRVTMVYGHYPEANQFLVKEYGVDKIATSVEEMLGNVDAVMVTARDGKFHSEFVKPFLEAGIPAFIDKPFTVDPEEAAELIAIAKKNNVPICGGSSLKFADDIEELKKMVADANGKIVGGTVSAPVMVESEYSGFFFYASHLTEMTLEVFGYNPRSVLAVRHDGGVCATIIYDDFCVSNHYNSGAYDYAVDIYSEAGTVQKAVDASMAGKKECEDFINMLHTGKMSRSYEEFEIPVHYMNAVKKAYETGEKVEICGPVLK